LTRTRNTQASKAHQTIRELMARGFSDEAMLIAAAADALGGDETAQIVAEMTWRKHFCAMGTN